MPAVSSLTLFCIAAMVLIITPGPDTLYVIARSIGQGRLAGSVSALGICAGTLVHTSAAAIGLSALLMTSALAYNFIKYLGAAYLIYLGVRTILNREEQVPLSTQPRISLTKTFSQGVLTNVLNPKVALFFLAFLPQFVNSSQGHIAWQIATLGLIFVAMTILWLTLVTLLTSSFEEWLVAHSGWSKSQRWFTGSVFIGLGIRIALPERK